MHNELHADHLSKCFVGWTTEILDLGMEARGTITIILCPMESLLKIPKDKMFFFQNDEWAYRLAASLQHLGNNEDGENVQVSMNNETEVEEIMGTDNSVDIPVTKKGKKVAASKNIARRGEDSQRQRTKSYAQPS